MNTDPIVVEATFNASICVVWEAITNKEHMCRWFFETIADFEPKIGFETQFDVEAEGKTFPHNWKVTEVVPKMKIAYDWRYEGYPGDSLVTWQLSDTPDGTNLKLTHCGYETLQTGMSGDPRESCEAGWQYFIHDRLNAFLAGHNDSLQ